MAEQQYLDLKHLDKQLDEFEKKKKKIKKMRIGYKLFLCTRQISQNPYPIRVLPS